MSTFIGTDIFGREVAVVRGQDGSFIAERMTTKRGSVIGLSMSPQSAAEFRKWLDETEPRQAAGLIPGGEE